MTFPLEKGFPLVAVPLPVLAPARVNVHTFMQVYSRVLPILVPV